MPETELSDDVLETSFITFGETILGFDLYGWQCEILEVFDEAGVGKVVQASLVTPNGSGKALENNEPVLTPSGWRPIASLKIGDAVFAGDGTITAVTGVWPQGVKQVFKVTFSDGAWTRCCADHLWTRQSAWQRTPSDPRYKGHWEVSSLSQMMKLPRLHRYIPIAGAVQHPKVKLPIDPYTLGVLLGDGCLQPNCASVCTRHDTLAICQWPEGVSLHLDDERGIVSSWRITDANKEGRQSVFLNKLRTLELDGKRSWEKFIPYPYNIATAEERLALLRGLMDTDGTQGKKTSSPEFNTTSPLLAAGVIDLVRSLGGIATMTTRIPSFVHKGVKKKGRMDHRIRIKLPVCPFRVERKANIWGLAETYKPCRIMETAEPDGEHECTCITVAHESQTYITRDYIVTHNSAVVIPTLALGWLALFPQGRVVITTADGKQLDGQIMPAIQAHRDKFENWTFIEREVRNPVGGRITAFTTDDPGRAEGWHKVNDLDGPLLIIADEAKTIPEEMFTAIDRCTYNALLLTSSPGHMSGRFYDSQTNMSLPYTRVKVGLLDCPHISQDKIDRLYAQYGPNGATPNPEFLKSTLHGEFMAADGEARFNTEGLERLRLMAEHQDKLDMKDKEKAQVGWLEEGRGMNAPIGWIRDWDTGCYWIIEQPQAGAKYIGFCDPTTGKQAEGSKTRDGCSAGIMRLGYTKDGVEYNDEVVALLHGHNFTQVNWDNDIVVERLDILLRYYGDCPVNVESNNAGPEVISGLQALGRYICRRKRRDHKHPGKVTEIVGFQTTAASKMQWVGAVVEAIREQTLDCRYMPMVRQFHTFVLDESGRGEAQSGQKDDHVTGTGLALIAKHWSKAHPGMMQPNQFPGVPWRTEEARVGGAWS